MRHRARAGRVAACACACACALSLAAAVPAAADEAAVTLTQGHLAAGTLAPAEVDLQAMIAADGANQEARFGLGMVRFVAAVEHLQAGLYRYGLSAPRAFGVPILRLPVPDNPRPQPIGYSDFRKLLSGFVDDLASAESALAAVTSPDVKLPVDLRRVAYDIDGDGRIGPEERLTALLDRVARIDDRDLPDDATVAFDLGDALWLRGYCNVFMALGEFMLAHDWRNSFDAAFHLFFPRVKSAMANELARARRGSDDDSFANIADAIAFIHLIRWPVTEPERMGAVRDHLKQVVALSRQTWDAIEAEGDDDREWLPSPDQHAAVVSLDVSTEQLDTWRTMLGEADAILDGATLVPHWRFGRGINLAKVFDDPPSFDLVLWISGQAALPYLQSGKVLDADEWRDMVRMFGRGFGAYLAWFN
jgi:hypothetical protein